MKNSALTSAAIIGFDIVNKEPLRNMVCHFVN